MPHTEYFSFDDYGRRDPISDQQAGAPAIRGPKIRFQSWEDLFDEQDGDAVVLPD